MYKFPLRLKDKIITLQDAINIIDYAITFIENHFDHNLKRYRVTIEVFSKLGQIVNGINDHKPDKQSIDMAVDVLKEIAENNITDENELRKIREVAALCKLCVI